MIQRWHFLSVRKEKGWPWGIEFWMHPWYTDDGEDIGVSLILQAGRKRVHVTAQVFPGLLWWNLVQQG